jgi:hypothetical protein
LAQACAGAVAPSFLKYPVAAALMRLVFGFVGRKPVQSGRAGKISGQSDVAWFSKVDSMPVRTKQNFDMRPDAELYLRIVEAARLTLR